MNSPFLSNLARWVYPYGSERRILFGPLRGFRFVVQRNLGLTYAFGLVGPLNLDFLADHLREGMVVFDIGANCGQVALFFASRVGSSGRVYAFEPAPVPFRALQKNLALNGLENVRALQTAISGSTGEEPFSFSERYPTAGKLSRLMPTEGLQRARSFLVRCTTLDDVIQQEGCAPGLLKIDVEGGAAGVLAGARRAIEMIGPSIYIELHNLEEQKAVRHELLPRGYKFQTLDGNPVADPASQWASPLWCFRTHHG